MRFASPSLVCGRLTPENTVDLPDLRDSTIEDRVERCDEQSAPEPDNRDHNPRDIELHLVSDWNLTI